MPKPRKLDAEQAKAFAQKHIKFSGGGLDRELWRAARKQELCGQLELPDEVGRRFKDMSDQLYLKPRFGHVEPPLELYRRAIRIQRALLALFSKRPWIWNEAVAARLIADAKRGNGDADQVLREMAAEYLNRGELPPKPLADYAAATLRTRSGRKRATQRSLKRSSDGHIALVIYAVSRKFGLKPTRNRATERPSGCSIVADAIGKSESLITKIWDKNKGLGRSNARDIVAEFLELDHDLDQILSGKSDRSRPQSYQNREAVDKLVRSATTG